LAEDIQYPLFRSLGLRLAFLGYDLDPTTVSVSADDTVDLTLWWQGLATMDRDYTAFVHLTASDGRLWAQEDKLLEHDGHSTSIWEPGAVVKQEFQLHLPPDIPPGEYTVKAGVYYWETGERLLVWDENRTRLVEDTILLQSMTVTK
jgi:hypothetical protein